MTRLEAVLTSITASTVTTAILLAGGLASTGQPPNRSTPPYKEPAPRVTDGLTEEQKKARWSMYEFYRKTELENAKERMPVIAGVPTDGYAFVICPNGQGFFVRAQTGQITAVTISSKLIESPNPELVRDRVFDFRTGAPIADVDDVIESVKQQPAKLKEDSIQHP